MGSRSSFSPPEPTRRIVPTLCVTAIGLRRFPEIMLPIECLGAGASRPLDCGQDARAPRRSMHCRYVKPFVVTLRQAQDVEP